MLARRFTIVCLVAALFGIGLAILVAGESRGRTSGLHAYGGCATDAGHCLSPITERYFARPQHQR